MAEHTELIRRLADDFTTLEETVLRQVNGVGAPETAAALEDPALVGPVAVVLAKPAVQFENRTLCVIKVATFVGTRRLRPSIAIVMPFVGCRNWLSQ